MAETSNKSGKVVDLKVLKRLFKFIRPYKGQFVLLIFLTILVAALSPLIPVIIQYTVDEKVSKGDLGGLVNMTILMVGVLVFQAISQYSHTYLSGWIGQYIIHDIRIQLYQHLLKLKLRFFDRTAIGKLVTRNISDVETLSEVFSQGVAAMTGDLLQLFVIVGFMLYKDWQLTLICLSTLPLLLISTYIFKEKIKIAFTEVRNAVASLNTFVQEHITGMSIVQIFNTEKREYESFEKINDEHRKANLRSVLYYSIYYPVAEVIQAIGIGLLVWYGAKGMMDDNLTLGILIEFIMFLQMFFRPIRLIADRFNTLQLGIVSTDRIMKLLDNEEHIDDNGTLIKDTIKGKVTFDHVWLAYEKNDYVLKDISFEVKPGETLALVGATGAGKSSVINLLNRFYEINKGNILVDDTDISDYDLKSLRSKIGTVLQDVFLFSDTIYNNITLGDRSISREKVLEAADLVGARRFIEKLPGGFDYNVMERGATLSVGQRQLISFVRTMVYNPAIIVLDEATSSVDSETEELIQFAIENLMKGRTAIVIAHRLSTIQKADKILVLEKGEIKESGSHDQLMAMNGHYTQLYKMQYKELV